MSTKPTSQTKQSLIGLLKLTQKLAMPYELDAMLADIVETGKKILDAEHGAVWLLRPETDELEWCDPESGESSKIAAEYGSIGQCLTSQRVINTSAGPSEPVPDDSSRPAAKNLGGSILNVPLIGVDQKPFGVMNLQKAGANPFSSDDEEIAVALAAQCAAALHRTNLSDALKRKERLDKEVDVARKIQMSTLPTKMPVIEGYEMFAIFKPAAHAGGDLFDLVMIGDRLFMLMGDATGHGFGPALSATQMQAMLRVAFRLGADLDEAYVQVNNQLAEDLPDDRFITAFMGFLDPRSNIIKFHAPGQGPTVHYRHSDNKCDWHPASNFPIGVMPIEEAGPAQYIEMGAGDILGLISDGIYEYERADGEQFGEQRVADILQSRGGLAMKDLGAQLLESAARFAEPAPQVDDITIVLLKRLSV